MRLVFGYSGVSFRYAMNIRSAEAIVTMLYSGAVCFLIGCEMTATYLFCI